MFPCTPLCRPALTQSFTVGLLGVGLLLFSLRLRPSRPILVIPFQLLFKFHSLHLFADAETAHLGSFIFVPGSSFLDSSTIVVGLASGFVSTCMGDWWSVFKRTLWLRSFRLSSTSSFGIPRLSFRLSPSPVWFVPQFAVRLVSKRPPTFGLIS